MTFLTEWVQNIAYYMIFMTVIVSLLPKKSYEKYIRFFAGIVLILLVVNPFLGGFRLEEEIVRFYQEFSFKQDTKELELRISGIEAQQRDMLTAQYEKAIGEDLKQMAERFSLETERVDVSVGMGKEMETGMETEQELGVVTEIFMKVHYVGEVLEDESKELAAQKSKNRFREQIIQYYRMEDEDVEIQLEER